MTFTDPQEPAQLRVWRHGVVARLLPPVIHHLNNAQAATLGVADLLTRQPERGAEFLEELHVEAGKVGQLLESFSRLAKDPLSGRPQSDLGGALSAASELLHILLHDVSGSLEVRLPEGTVAVGSTSQRLEQLVVGLAVTALGGASLPEERTPRCRLSVRARVPRRADDAPCVALHLTVNVPLDVDPDRGAVLAALDSELAARGGGLRLRSVADRGCTFRLVLVAPGGTESLGRGSARNSGPARRLAAHLGERTLAELVKAVLAETGHDVVLADSPAQLLELLDDPGMGFALLDAGELRGEDLERARKLAPRVALVSSGTPPEGAWCGVLRTPFRPAELMTFVDECRPGC